MEDQYLIVNTKILPNYFEKVVQARNLVDQKKVKGVSEAVQIVGISRSTYYKYKDYLFSMSTNQERRAVLALILNHQRGILNEVLNTLSRFYANILSINQSIPIHNSASVTLSLDISEIKDSIHNLIDHLKQVPGVSSVKLIALE